MKKIEICVDSVESIRAAEKGGADRVELCSALFEGGLTPTSGMLAAAKRASHLPVQVMIRPRGGDFLYSDEEFSIMCHDLESAKNGGADGVVFGLLTPDGYIDEERTARLIALAHPLPVTFHRAFDLCCDPMAGLEALIRLGVTRVLTSGLESSVLEGALLLAELVEKAKEEIIVMPGCGITERNLARIDALVHAKEYHMGLSSPCQSGMRYQSGRVGMGGTLRQDEYARRTTDLKRVLQARSALR